MSKCSNLLGLRRKFCLTEYHGFIKVFPSVSLLTNIWPPHSYLAKEETYFEIMLLPVGKSHCSFYQVFKICQEKLNAI